jgi:hypothetical protein
MPICQKRYDVLSVVKVLKRYDVLAVRALRCPVGSQITNYNESNLAALSRAMQQRTARGRRESFDISELLQVECCDMSDVADILYRE